MSALSTLWLLSRGILAQNGQGGGQGAEGDFWFEAAQRLAEWVGGLFGEWFQGTLFGIHYWQYIAAFVAILLGLVAKKVCDFVFERTIIPATKRTRFKFDQLLAEAVYKPLGVALFLLGLFAGLAFLALQAATPEVRRFAAQAMKVAFAVDLLWLVFRMVDVLAMYLQQMAAKTESKLDDQVVPLIKKSLKVFVGVLVFVVVVQNLGYSVSGILAGLGIGGLAVALAAQDTLANFFGGLVIFTDRPFHVGDWVKIGEIEGTVEQIGFRSTRIRTFPKTLITIPNKQVVDAAVNNMSAMPLRRVLMTIGVTYETKAEQMEALLGDIRALLAKEEGVDQEYIVVRFASFGSSSLDIVMLYFTKPIPYNEHLAVVERINLALMRTVQARGLSFAFPTRTIYFEGEVARSMGAVPARSQKQGSS